MARTVAEGGLDYYLTLPRDPLWHLLIARASASAWGDLLFSVIAYIWAVGAQPLILLALPFCLVAGGLVGTAFNVIVGTLAFYWGNSEGFATQLNGALLSFSLYPETIFSTPVGILLYTVIPAGFVTFLPVRLVRDFHLEHALLLAAVALASMFVAWQVFYRGLVRYESGNLVTTRL